MRSPTALFFVLPIALSIAAAADAAPALSGCRQITDDLQRLACYDSAVDALLGLHAAVPASGATAGTAPSTPAASPPAAVAPDESAVGTQATEASSVVVNPETIFGRVDSTDTTIIHELFGVPTIDSIESTVTEARRAPDGKRVFALANGQIWAQTDGSNLTVAVGDAVRIRRGTVGAFFLSGSTTKKSMRVKRIG